MAGFSGKFEVLLTQGAEQDLEPIYDNAFSLFSVLEEKAASQFAFIHLSIIFIVPGYELDLTYKDLHELILEVNRP
jgi:hypothetical protein